MGKKLVAGRGRRVCSCGEVVAVRTKVCPACHKEFPKKEKKDSTEKSTPSKSTNLRIALEQELTIIQETLANKSKMEQKAKIIQELLKTM